MLELVEKYSYNDVAIVPAVISNISSRKECIPFDGNGFYPLFTAPMTNVVDFEAAEEFEKNNIYSILPRMYSFTERINYARQTKRWVAVSLKEFSDNFLELREENFGLKILIDVANGHMAVLYELAKKCKDLYGNNITLMVGNIANPETYKYAIYAGISYVRCSIGTGKGCLTTSNVSTHFPIVSLIDEIYKIKKEYSEKNGIKIEQLPKIVADGGIRNYSDVIKALAVGADYVMVGGLFSSLLGSAGEMVDTSMSVSHITRTNVTFSDGKFFAEGKEITPKKLFYGMASKNGQKDFGNKILKTSEGLVKWIDMKHTISGWVENFDSYLRSAMSYTNSKNIDEMKNARVILISQATQNSINK